MYRSRPKGTMDDEVLAFLSSIQHDQSILYYDIIGSEAHSVMLHERGVISLEELKRYLPPLRRQRTILTRSIRKGQKTYTRRSKHL